MIAFRIEGNIRYSQTKISRSMFPSRTRDRALRLSTITCCRKTMFSASSLARDFSLDRATSSSLIRNSTIGFEARVQQILAVTLQFGRREINKWQDWVILIPAFVLVGIFHISLVPVLVVLAPIAIQLNRPDRKELAAYHAQQAEYHAQLAEHHEEVAARHTASDSTAGTPS